MSQTRRLAAILAADVAGYSRLMGADEEGTHERLDDARGMVQRLRMITPIVVHNASQYRNAEHRELFLSGLRLATGEAT